MLNKLAQSLFASLKPLSFQISQFAKMAAPTFNYPNVYRDETIKDNYHGIEIPDPYRWLENPDSPKTKAFIDDQNNVTKPYLENYCHRKEIEKKLTELWDFPKVYQPFREGDKYYQYRNSGLQNQNVIWTHESLNGLITKATVFFDPNGLSGDGTTSLQMVKFSEDGKLMAYGLCVAGSDWTEIKFKDINTNKDFNDTLKKVKFTTLSWTHDNKGLFYCAYLDEFKNVDGTETDTLKNQKIYYHYLGQDQNKDVLVVEFEDPSLRLGGHVSYCGKYLLVTCRKGVRKNHVYYAHLEEGEKITSKLKLLPIVTSFDADFELITNNGTNFFFKTNKDAPNYKIIVIDFEKPNENNWVTLIPEHPKDVLEQCVAINTNNLLLVYLRDVKHIMQVHSIDSGKKLSDIYLPVGSVTGVSGKRQHTEIFFAFTSLLIPITVFRLDFSGAEVRTEVYHETHIGNINLREFDTKQVFYESKDGTKIPMFLLHKKNFNQNGQHPCLLYAYGGFAININPSFSISRLLFVQKFDGVFALANIRGGGEYGEKWHDGGKLDQKQNCFDDFQWAAKYLITENFTSKRLVIIQGGSNGGLLVGTCINQAPDLYGAAICHVGVLDMLRFHKFTIGYAWTAEYGSPEKPDQFKYLLKYSPLHNIKDPGGNVQYPATLLLTADHDDRVVPLHSFKFISELQYKLGNKPQQKYPLMIRIETKAGHGAGKPTNKIIEEIVDVFCFYAKALNLEYKH